MVRKGRSIRRKISSDYQGGVGKGNGDDCMRVRWREDCRGIVDGGHFVEIRIDPAGWRERSVFGRM